MSSYPRGAPRCFCAPCYTQSVPDMYAVIKTGGKQYRVAENDVIRVEKLEAEVGSDFSFDQVLLIGGNGDTNVGTPLLTGAAVKATVLDQIKDDKVIIFKKKRRKNYRKKQGHRQRLTVLRIKEIAA